MWDVCPQQAASPPETRKTFIIFILVLSASCEQGILRLWTSKPRLPACDLSNSRPERKESFWLAALDLKNFMRRIDLDM